MIAPSDTPHHTFDPHADTFVHDTDTEPPASLSEPVTPSEAGRRQIWALTLPPATLGTLVGGVAAVLTGGAVGYWLGRRSVPRAPRQIRRASGSVGSMVELVPMAMQLLANPIVRAIVVRAMLRQITQRIPS